MAISRIRPIENDPKINIRHRHPVFSETRTAPYIFTTLAAGFSKKSHSRQKVQNGSPPNAKISRLDKKRRTCGLCIRNGEVNFGHSPAQWGPLISKKTIIFGPRKIGLEFWSLRKQSDQNISKNWKNWTKWAKWASSTSETRAA